MTNIVRTPVAHHNEPSAGNENGFSAEFKHSDVTLTSNSVATRERDTSGGEELFGIILAVSVLGSTSLKLKDEHFKVYTCRMRMLKIRGGIYLGLTLQKRAKLFGFEESDWSEKGHGNYLVSNYGHQYCHSGNDEVTPFRFEQGDTVEMEFDTTSMVLRYSTGVE